MGKRLGEQGWIHYGIKSNNGSPFDEVFHISHLLPSTLIIRNERIKAGLVYDESILNTKRISVIWVSPNHWVRGSRYGNVRFKFPWKDIVKRKKYYWVEAITKYSPAACRILVTNND